MVKSDLRLGTDVVYLPRFLDKVNDERFIKRILTKAEQSIFNDITNERLKLEFLAGRYACKEAYSKAVGTGIGKLDFLDVEVLRNEHGAPVSTKGNFSISHDNDYLLVVVIA